MSEQATLQTSELLTWTLPAIAERQSDGLDGVLDAYERFHYRIDEIINNDLFDADFARRLGETNALERGLDTEGADAVFDVRMRLPRFDRAVGEYSSATSHIPLNKIWQGTGANMTTDERGAVVHYVNRPSPPQEKYGPAEPYILRKLGWSLMLRALDEPSHHTPHGYGITKLLLKSRGLMAPDASMHMGSVYVPTDLGYMHGSTSGTLVEEQVDSEFQTEPFYARMAKRDEEAGLYDWLPDRRAGLYDVIFARQVITALTRGIDALQGHSFILPDPVLYEDMDIN